MPDARIRALYRPDVDGPPPTVHLVTDGAYPDGEALRALVAAAAATESSELHLLAWEHPPDARRRLQPDGDTHAPSIRLVLIPRETLGRPSRKPPVFREVGELVARTITHADGSLDVELSRFNPGLAISPKREATLLAERAVIAGFDFVDYWAVDFDHEPGGPFHHRWHWGRSSRGRRIPLISDARWPRRKIGQSGRIAVKVTDVFGYETLTLLDPR